MVIDSGWIQEADETVAVALNSAGSASTVRRILARLIERSRADGAAAEAKRINDEARGWVELLMPSGTEEGDRCRSIAEEAMSWAKQAGYEEGVAAGRARIAELETAVEDALISALRAEEAHEANPHTQGSHDPLAPRLYNHGVRAAELAQCGARHVAERLFALCERSHAETKRLRARIAELEAAVPAPGALVKVTEVRGEYSGEIGLVFLTGGDEREIAPEFVPDDAHGRCGTFRVRVEFTPEDT